MLYYIKFVDQLLLSILIIPLLLCILTNILNSKKKKIIINILSYIILNIISIFLFYYIYNNNSISYELGFFNKYGIILVLDLLSIFFINLSLILCLFILLYSINYMDLYINNNAFFSVFNIMTFGINGIFLTGDLFNLYVFFEIIFLSSSVSIFLQEKLCIVSQKYKIEAVYKYFIINFLCSSFFLISIIFIYSYLGSLNFQDISNKIYILNYYGNYPPILIASILLLLVTFCNKASIFPLHFWLPDIHPNAPTPISALLSGLFIKIGIYCIMRIHFIVFCSLKKYILPLLFLLSIITIIIGTIGSCSQNNLKKILAYSSIAQIGFICSCLSLDTLLSISTSIVYIIAHSLSKSVLFLISGIIIQITKTKYISEMGGLIDTIPEYSFLFLINGLSIAGLPPFIGFFSKILLLRSFIEINSHLYLFIIVISSSMTLYYIINTWTKIFYGKIKNITSKKYYSISWSLKYSIYSLSLIMILLSFNPNILFIVSNIIVKHIFFSEIFIYY